MKKISLLLVYLCCFIYFEFLYRFLLYDKVFRVSNINMLLFIVFFAFLMFLISKIFNEKVNKHVFCFCLIIIFLWFVAQYVAKSFLDFYLSFSILQIADQVGDFMGKAVLEVFKRTGGILLFSLPIILLFIFRKRLNFSRISMSKFVPIFLMTLCLFAIYESGLKYKKNKAYSPYILYHQVNNPALSVESLGVINTFSIDLYRVLFGFNENILFVDDENIELAKDKYGYNKLSFDFESFKNETSDKVVNDMTSYFEKLSASKKNRYSGFFKGKNLILFMAESFNEIAVTKETTPTLYRLINDGFKFDNYYTPTIYSTIGGEFQELTGLYANFSALSKYREGVNTFPMGIATMFENNDYKTYAYHDNSYLFQNRDKYLKSLGFKNFKACYNGLESEINCKQWPQSDVEMINSTVDDYINDEKPFMVFYASVSGHASYDWSNAMSKKHRSEIEKLNLGYSQPVLAYMAAQMEFDKALEVLIDKLTEAGKLDDTVIVFAGDHYPYELTTEQVNEASSYKKDSVIEINHSNLAIWNNKLNSVVVDKVASTIDILPTLYNLFGLDYDSRVIIGSDIFSPGEGLAMFSNNSWVSDRGKYFASSGKFEPKGDDVDDEYVSYMNHIVQNKIVMSKYIVEKDYYKLLWNYKS